MKNEMGEIEHGFDLILRHQEEPLATCCSSVKEFDAANKIVVVFGEGQLEQFAFTHSGNKICFLAERNGVAQIQLPICQDQLIADRRGALQVCCAHLANRWKFDRVGSGFRIDFNLLTTACGYVVIHHQRDDQPTAISKRRKSSNDDEAD